MNFEKIRYFHSKINRCELRLQHSSRKTEPYWLAADLYLYAGGERRIIIFLGAGSKTDSEEAFQRLHNQGFTKTGAKLNQEWYQINFVREFDDHLNQS